MAKNEAVLDAGPLIHLAELDTLDALQGFSALYVSKEVTAEVRIYQPAALQVVELKFVIAPSPELTPGLLALGQALLLDLGELESLSLMQLHPDAVFLTDDSAARLAAEQMGYRTHGTIGLIIRMARKGYRKPSEVLDLLKKIPDKSSLHLRQALLEEIIQTLKREWGLS